MVKKDRIKPFRTDDGTSSSDEVVDISSTLRKDRTPIPDKRFTLPPKYGVTGGGSSDTTDEYKYNGYEYIDLGLPSGTKWAKANVGAESETDAGLYFAWGETTGYTASQVGTDKNFSFDDYALTEDGGSTFTKYNAIDGKTTLDLEDDAAHVNMGGDWHMPNMVQYIELFEETKNGFVTNVGAFTEYTFSNTNFSSSPTETTATISGWDTAGYFFFKSDVSDMNAAIANGDYLFIPAAGDCENGEVYDVDDRGYVWASLRDNNNATRVGCFQFNGGGASFNAKTRCYGLSIRGVVGQMDETTPGGGGESGPVK